MVGLVDEELMQMEGCLQLAAVESRGRDASVCSIDVSGGFLIVVVKRMM